MSACKGCGKEIVWGITEDGKKIPLDPKPPVYFLSGFKSENGDGPEIARAKDAMVSHFATCSKANDFSGSKKKEPAQQSFGSENG